MGTTPNLSKAKQRLIADAMHAGFVVRYSDHVATIWQGKKPVIQVWERGLSTRADIRLDLAIGMSVHQVREFLKLSKQL